MLRVLLRPSVVAATGLIAGFAVARASGRRQAGGALFAAAGNWCLRQWWKSSGPVTAVGLGALYAAAMGGSHPLAKRIGAWPSVLAVSVVVAGASEIATRQGRGARTA